MLSQGAVEGLSNFMFYDGRSKAFFDMVFDIFSDTGLPLGGLLMVLFISRKWGMDKFDKEIESGNSSYLKSITRQFLYITIKWVTPILLSIIFVITILQKFMGIQIMG